MKLPIHCRVYETFNRESSWRELHVDLRLIPSGGVLVGLAMFWLGAPILVVAAVAFVPCVLADQVWPLSGGPALPLYRRRVG